MANFRIKATVASIKLENNLITALSMRKDAMCALMILGRYGFSDTDIGQTKTHKHTLSQSSQPHLQSKYLIMKNCDA